MSKLCGGLHVEQQQTLKIPRQAGFYADCGALGREGRAFGVGIVIGTQFPGDIPETLAGNLATQLFLMNNQAQHRRFVVKQMFGTTSGTEPRKLLDSLKWLKQFEGLFSNANQSALMRVTPYHERPETFNANG
jgi:hypothetical protein